MFILRSRQERKRVFGRRPSFRSTTAACNHGFAHGLIVHLPEISHRDERVSAAPELSPGVVEDDEIVLREMFNPEHVRDGEVIERAVPVDDLRYRGILGAPHEICHASVHQGIDGKARGEAAKGR